MTLIPRILAWSPPGLVDPRLVVAGSRAGALGVFDLTLPIKTDQAETVMRVAAEALGRRTFGVRVPADAPVAPTLEVAPANLSTVILAGSAASDWPRALDAVRRWGRTAVADVATPEAASLAFEAGFDAVVVGGNEAGGVVGELSSFILLQAVLGRAGTKGRVWVRGGIGPAGAAGCVATGAAGVVLDGSLLLARESAVPASARERIERWDGSETTGFGRDGGGVRGFCAPGSPLLSRLRGSTDASPDLVGAIGWGLGELWPVGQDSALAADLARRFVTVGGIVQEVERAIDESLADARRVRPLAGGSPLAESHGTRYPIVQGPMTRVSDRAAFAGAVAGAGGLPFLALALMRGGDLSGLLREARATLDGKPWGVGLLGFADPDLRREQTEAVLAARPPFALIAGGRPDQAAALERAGITTYLHVPSPGLLAQFLREGARRFVLEGRECGGHVGPRSSLVLWEQAGRTLSEGFEQGVDPSEVHILYAGGVHDARSGAGVAGIAAPLAARGVRVGVLVGTAYLFTTEAVMTGAIVEGFQREALRCSRTVLLETGPGHVVRVSPTPFTERFGRERERLVGEGRSAEAIRTELEALNVGRLRVAAKGVDRPSGADSPLSNLAGDHQYEHGLYMLGQAATLRGALTTIENLHREIADGSAALLERGPGRGVKGRRKRSRPSNVAIIGMAAVVPGAGDVRRFWENTLRERDAIREVPGDRWDASLYFNADPKAPDKITSRWGGFVPDVPFDPLRYGMPPASLPSIEPLHLLTLEVVRAALEDAGYRDRPFPRERTAVVLGAGGGAAQLAMGYAFRSYLPLLDTVIPGAGSEALAKCGPLLPEWTEDSFPGILLNVAAGRVANRFDLGGANYTVDAACGSSLAAASLAVRELESGAADVVVLGGADTVQNPFTYLAFSKTHAFSTRGRCRPFDAKADGIVISEGVAVVILKRLADAERDGDRIYGVLKGLGASSDGRAKGLTAPRFEGQVRALDRAYDKAGVSPATVGYVEAHGTGTAAGDLAEVSALKDVFREAGAAPGACALGSVKSLIGHTKCAAGLAGLINATLALHHRVLPPTIGIEAPNPKAGIPGSPFHLSTKTRPWLRSDPTQPRRAGVSAFGFGGTNFHAVVEAYEADLGPRPAPTLDRPAELFVWRASDRAALLREMDFVERALAVGPVPLARDLAHTLSASASTASAGVSLAVVAADVGELRAKLATIRSVIASGRSEVVNPSGIAYAGRSPRANVKVAFLFPGQGSQSPDMLSDLAVHFPDVLDGFDMFDRALASRGRRPVGPLVFPPPSADEPTRERQAAALAAADVAQPALGAASVGLLRLLGRLGLRADTLAGHSYGELVALHAAGVFPLDALAELSEARGRFLLDAVGSEPGAMAAVQAGPTETEALLDGSEDVVLANRNGPSQTVVSGPREAVARLVARAGEQGRRARLLPVACGFHSPLVAGARGPLVALASRLVERAPDRDVYSNVNASQYRGDASVIATNLGDHLVRPVRFAEMIEAMHRDGATVFVEVGPGSVLTSLVGSILGDKPHIALACEPLKGRGLAGFLAMLGRLFVAGVKLDLAPLTGGRGARRLARVGDRFEDGTPPLPASAWLVNGNRARPANAPESPRFGPGAALPKPEPHTASPNGNGHANGNGRDYPSYASRLTERNGHGATPRPALSAGVGDADEVVLAFQKTMQTFLDVQRSTMLGFLAAGEAAPIPPRTVRHEPFPVRANGHASPAPVRRTRPPAEPVTPSPRPDAAEPAVRAVAPDVEGRLLAIVRDRTGYPLEMLRPDLDLEADLGIDSIKRVEILGTLRDSLPEMVERGESGLMDQLARAKTLGAIVDRLRRHLGPAPPPFSTTEVVPVESTRASKTVAASQIRRMVLEAVDAPLPTNDGPGPKAGGLVLVTDDGRGVARSVAGRLARAGYTPVRLVHGETSSPRSDDAVPVDLRSPEAVSRVVEGMRGRGPVVGLIHALPLRTAPDAALDPKLWDDRMALEVRGLFLLARACSEQLAASAKGGGGGGRLVAATAMGGAFASLPDGPADFFPGHGGIAGLVKTLAREWDGVRTRVVDLAPSEPVETLAKRLSDEFFADDSRPEVGYQGGRRIALRPVVRAGSGGKGPSVKLRPGEPVLITGGARGITASVALDLARRWQPTLLLVGSSASPTEHDDPDLSALTDPAAVKARLLARLERDGRSVGPVDLERAYQDFRRGCEIRGNLKAMRDLGATVEYARADVRDPGAMRRVLGVWVERYGPPAGLIHGAGVIQDKLLKDKTPESFDRVVGTKLDGALTLARLVDPGSLKFAAFFSSIAGRFGNRGQADYAAANDALNKLAVWLDRRWPGRVVSLVWGPWSGVGMVSDLEAHLGRRGLGMIPPEEGAPRVADELQNGAKGEVEVIVAGSLGNLLDGTEGVRES